MDYIIGVDIGGTFTDCVILDSNGKLTIGKALSTPHDFSLGVVDSLEDGAANLGLPSVDDLLRSTRLFFHACTVADNTLITRTGARTGLVVTQGFPDTFLMMRGNVTHGLTEAEGSHIAALEKPEPLAPRSLTEQVQGRIDYKGSVLIDADDRQIEEVVERLVAKGVESVAVCLLWSIANDAHEKAVADVIRRRHPGIHVSCSSDVAPFLGEYERTATTIFNAYIGPPIASYLRNLRQNLADRGLGSDPLVMQAYGGMLSIEATSQRAIGALESGPAAGVVGSKFIGDLIGEPNVLAADMGGTTFKVSLVRKRRHRARLPAGVRALPHSGAQDLGGVHRRGWRQHRLDRPHGGPAQGRPPGSGRRAGPGGLRPRRDRAHGVRRRRGPRVSEPGLFPGRPSLPEQGWRHGRHRGADRQSPWG